VTSSFRALTSATKVLIPTPNQIFSIVFDQFLNATDLATAKPTAPLEPHRIKPELSQVTIALNMDMFRLIAITSVEEEPIKSDS
jgi:hypothetical protein